MSTCKICAEAYKKPVVLPCGHTFCQICIVSWSEKEGKLKKTDSLKKEQEEEASGCEAKHEGPEKVSCPSCREKHVLPEGGAAFFTRNYDFPTSENIMCEWCEEAEAEVKCQDCDEWLCNVCQQKHNEIKKKNKDHVMFTIEEAIKVKMKTQYKLCLRHGKKAIEFYCSVCNEPCCLTGNNTIHKLHESITLDEQYAKICSDLKQGKDNIKKSLKEFEKLGDTWKTYEQMKSSDKNVFTKEVEQRKSFIIQDAERKENEAVQAAKNKKKEIIKEAEKEERKSIRSAEEARKKIVNEVENKSKVLLKSLFDYDNSLKEHSHKVINKINAQVNLMTKSILEIDKQLQDLSPSELHDKKEELAKLINIKITTDNIPRPTWESFSPTQKKNFSDCGAAEYLGNLEKIIKPPEPVLVAEINVQVKTDKNECNIYDVVVLSDNVLAVADDEKGNNKVKLFHIDGHLITESNPTDFSDPSWLIQNPNDQDHLLVSNYNGDLQNINVYTGHVTPLTSELPHLIGVCVTKYKDEVTAMVGQQNPNELVILNPTSWSILERFTLTEKGAIEYISGHAEHDVVAVADIIFKSVSFYKQGQFVSRTDNNAVQNPRGMSMMRNGWVLVADACIPSIIILSESGQLLTTLLFGGNDLTSVWAVHYNETHQLLAVSSRNKLKLFRW